MTAITADQLMRQMRAAMASLGPVSPPALEIVVSHNLPVEYYADKIWPLYAPPWFAVILRLFKISPFVCWAASPLHRDKSFRMGNKLIVSPRTYAAMKGEIAKP